MMLPMTETMKVSKSGSILRVLTGSLEERRGMMSVLGQSVRGRRGKVLTLESVVENTGYGERKRVSKLRGEVSEGSTSLEASTYILPVNKELVIRWINVGATIEISKGQTD